MMRTIFYAIGLLAIISAAFAGTVPSEKVGNAPWSPRANSWLAYTSRPFQYTVNSLPLTLPSGSYISFGGTPSSWSNDVWVSEDTLNWNMIGGRTPTVNSTKPDDGYVAYTGSAQCQDISRDYLYVIGGEVPQQPLNAGFRSENGGATFVRFTIPFNVSYSNCIVDGSSSLYLLNGLRSYNRTAGNLRNPSNEVWVSSNSGGTFTKLTDAPYPKRMAAAVGIALNAGPNQNTDIIYVIAGMSIFENNGTENPLSDVWVSTTRAQSWIKVSDGQIPDHEDTTLVVSKLGMIVLIGGRNFHWATYPVIYASLDGGRSWGYFQPTLTIGYSGRIFPSAVFDSAGYLHIAGGEDPSKTKLNDVYRTKVSLEANLPATATYLELDVNIYNPARLCLGFLPCYAPLNTIQIGNFSFGARFHHAMFATRKALTFNPRIDGKFPATSFPAGSIIVAGGENEFWDNDVWISADGTSNSWYLIGGRSSVNSTLKYDSYQPNKSFTLYGGQAVCNSYDGDVLLFAGGDSNNRPMAESYTSVDGGATWTKNPAATSFLHRSWAACGFDSKNVAYLLTGNIDYDATSGDRRDVSNDVWRSADLGKTWYRILEKAPFPPRGAPGFAVAYAQGAAADKDLLYLVGGFTDYNEGRHADALNDVWVSPDSGLTWICTTSAASWVKRADLSVAVSRAGVLVVSGGRTDGADVHDNFYVFNDIWISFDGGYKFFLIEESTFSPRRLHGIFVDGGGNLVVSGGEGGRNADIRYLRSIFKTTAASFNKPKDLLLSLHKSDRADVVTYNDECAGYFIRQGESCPAYLDPPAGGLSTGAIAAIVILVIVVVVAACGWSFYSIRVHGELRIPCTTRSCNCCNNALKGDQLADDGFALHKGTGKLKTNLNGSLHHRLIDE